MASNNIAKISPLDTSHNVDKFHLPKDGFRPVGEGAMAFDFKNCCTAKGQRFRCLNKNHFFQTYSRLVYSESRKGVYCKYCTIFSTSLVNSRVGKNCQKSGKLVIEPLFSFNKLTVCDGYVYERDRLEYHKSMTIDARW